MAHFHIEYSGNLESLIDISELCEIIRAEAAAIETFPTPGVRVRAVRVDHYAIADGNPRHGFIDISIRLRGGRSDDDKRQATQRIFEVAKRSIEPVMQKHPIALSLEMRDIDPELSPKTGTIREYL